ncbi:unnamed protein product [Caenorhabditis nigoni]
MGKSSSYLQNVDAQLSPPQKLLQFPRSLISALDLSPFKQKPLQKNPVHLIFFSSSSNCSPEEMKRPKEPDKSPVLTSSTTCHFDLSLFQNSHLPPTRQIERDRTLMSMNKRRPVQKMKNLQMTSSG